jgi:integrase
MGNIQKRESGKWRARYRDPSGRERARHFRRKIDAERWLASVENSKHRGEWIDPALARITVGEWSARWLESQTQLKPLTLERYGNIVRVQILPEWDRIRLSAIAHADVVSWVASLRAEGYAASTVRQVHRVFSLMLTLAVRDRRIPNNPAEGVKLPRAAKGEPRFLTHDQVEQLAQSCPGSELLVRLLAYTGLRWGEAVALRVGRLDLMRRRAEIVHTAIELDGEMTYGTPKTHQRRSVPTPRTLVDALAEHVGGMAPDDLVFTSPRGEVMRNHNFRSRVVRACCCRDRRARAHSARPPPYRGEPCRPGRRQCEGGAEHARARVGSDDSGRLRRTVRRRSRRRRGSFGRGCCESACGLFADCGPNGGHASDRFGGPHAG